MLILLMLVALIQNSYGTDAPQRFNFIYPLDHYFFEENAPKKSKECLPVKDAIYKMLASKQERATRKVGTKFWIINRSGKIDWAKISGYGKPTCFEGDDPSYMEMWVETEMAMGKEEHALAVFDKSAPKKEWIGKIEILNEQSYPELRAGLLPKGLENYSYTTQKITFPTRPEFVIFVSANAQDPNEGDGEGSDPNRSAGAAWIVSGKKRTRVETKGHEVQLALAFPDLGDFQLLEFTDLRRAYHYDLVAYKNGKEISRTLLESYEH